MVLPVENRIHSDRRDRVQDVLSLLSTVVVGKVPEIRLALTCLLAGGHLLIEDIPGVGKTTLARALARVLGLPFQRIQFTSDLLPTDIIGTSVYDPDARHFHFEPGPLFASLILADEINRATPRTQSALLEAMEENQVTVEGETRPLPDPFFVIATENPAQQVGTYPLPESQLDRFLMCLTLGYPDPESEAQLWRGLDPQKRLRELPALLKPEDLVLLRKEIHKVTATEPLLRYLAEIVRLSRASRDVEQGLSPRAALGLLAAGKAHAWLNGRTSLWPDDIQAVFVAVSRHRLAHSGIAQHDEDRLTSLLRAVPVP
ncbi:MAG: AAA family ATPase [Gammaproteobacteria bacterium]